MVFGQILKSNINQAIIQEKLQKLRKKFTKLEKKNSIGISVFGYENKEKYPIYLSKKCCEEKHVELLLIGKREN